MSNDEHPAADALRAAGFGPNDEAWMQAAIASRKCPSLPAYTELRALRLWHWQQCLMARTNGERAASGRDAERYRKEWALHMGAVQTLNAFFPLGDYATADADRQDV